MSLLSEKLSYDQLFRMSGPKRVLRSLTVKGPPLEIDSYQDALYYFFNFKSNPSTTHLRHKGYVRFLRPISTRNTPLSKLNVEVDCTCPDYRYRWAWANKQRQAGHVGPQSLNQALNKAPRKTNPKGHSGLCKHILAARQYIYGLIASFEGDEPDTADKLNKLTKYATKRWINYDSEVEKAKEREAIIAQNKALRNIGIPPSQRGRQVNFGATQLPEPLPGDESPEQPDKNDRDENDNPLNPQNESVCMMTNMKTTTLTESELKPLVAATKIVQEMEDDLMGGGDIGSELGDDAGGGDMPPPSGGDMPLEPEVSDSAIGASTEDNVALGLLRDIRDLLQQMAEPGEELETPEMPTDDDVDGEGDDLGEPPAGEEDEDVRPGARPIETGV